jgi:hypothetical protein
VVDINEHQLHINACSLQLTNTWSPLTSTFKVSSPILQWLVLLLFFFLCSPFSGSLVTCFILLFVLIFPLLHFFVLTMDHRRHKLLVALVFFMAIQHVFTIVVVLQQVAIHQHNSTMMMMGALILGGDAPRLLSIWMIEQNRSFTFTQLLGNYTPSLFRQHTRLHRSTFHYLCSIVAPSLVREDTCIRKSISLETRVAISLSCLSTGNTLQMCGEAGLSRWRTDGPTCSSVYPSRPIRLLSVC